MEVVLLLAVLFVGGYFGIRAMRRAEQSSFTESGDAFSSNGVTIHYRTGDLIINGCQTHVSRVSGVRWESEVNRKGWVARYNSVAFITIEDMRRPMHKISMVGEHTAEQFLERFKFAVMKAGGPTFS